MTTSLDSPKRPSFLKRAWLRMQAQWRGQPLVRWLVRYDDLGFTVERSRVGEVVPKTTVVRWIDVERVEAFKRDLITIDQVCVGMLFADDWWIQVDEDIEGFYDFIGALPRHLHGCLPPDRWWREVDLPAFETNRMVLWDRAKSDAV
jgi:hypothetical protein